MKSETDLLNTDDVVGDEPVVAGAAVRVPFGIGDVGGELVSMFSEGLYGDPRDALREYVQNAVDAGTPEVELRFTGRDLVISDKGAGMDFESLVAARRIGKSLKSTTTSVGFRGIGVYAGFQICDRVVITTRKADSDRRWTLTFDFVAMRAVLVASRLLLKRSTSSDLGPLISEHTTIAFQPAEPSEPSGTTVILEAISKAAYHELSEPDELKAYLRRTLPVDYSDSFEYKAEVDEYLRRRVPDYKTIKIKLKIEDIGIDEKVTQEFPSGLGPPVFLDAMYPLDSDNVRAVIWACHSAKTRLGSEAGLFFRLKGFTIGDGRELRTDFKRPVVFDWYIGEVHIIDSHIIPNVARNDFESNLARRELRSALKVAVDDLNSRAVRYQSFSRAVEVIDEVEHELSTFALTTDVRAEPVECYERLGKLEARLSVQRVPAFGSFWHAMDLDVARKRKKALTDDLKQLRVEWRQKVDGGVPDDHQEPKEKRKPNISHDVNVPRAEAASLGEYVLVDGHWLEAVFAECGWKLTAQTREVMAVIAQALTDADLTTASWRNKFVELLNAILSRGS